MKKTIAIFFGGPSVEHEISVISAMEAWPHFDQNLYHLVPVYISKEGGWYTGSELLKLDNYTDISVLLKKCHPVYFKMEKDFILYQGLFKKIKIDCCFPITHGTYVEDGGLQGLFYLKKIPFVGSKVLPSALAINKILTKKILDQEGILTVEGLELHKKDFYEAPEKSCSYLEKLQYPLIIKPFNLGSSVGISKAKTREELEKALALAFEYAPKVLVEKALQNFKELNCSVLGIYPQYQASIIEEVFSSGELLSYEDKYLTKQGRGMSVAKRELPAKIDEQLRKNIEDISLKVAKIFNLSGVARIDFLYEDKKLYVSEINTIPGSLSFFLWKDRNISFKHLLTKMIQDAFIEKKEQDSFFYDHTINILKNFKKSSKLKI